MDYRATVTGRSPVVEPHETKPTVVLADQAIFTSLRTPTGEGYRLVAMSPGITAEERAEITRRSPSHGSLCDETPMAMALATYPMASRRQCVACSRYAGREHTARGGQRVHTHLVVIERSEYRCFENNPVPVQAAMLQAIGPTPNLKPTTCLEKLHLDPTVRPEDLLPEIDARGPSQDQLDHACRVASVLMQDGQLVVAGAGLTPDVLQWVLTVMPVAARADLSIALGLKYSPSRQMRITLVDHIDGELHRALQGQDVRIMDLRTGGAPEEGPYHAWFEFVRERGRAGRFEEVSRLTADLDDDSRPGFLDRLVAISRDIDRVREADRFVLEKLVGKYAGAKPFDPTEARLVRQLISATVSRAADLREGDSHRPTRPSASSPDAPQHPVARA